MEWHAKGEPDPDNFWARGGLDCSGQGLSIILYWSCWHAPAKVGAMMFLRTSCLFITLADPRRTPEAHYGRKEFIY